MSAWLLQRLGDLRPPVADVDAPQPGHRVEVGLALIVRERAAAPFHDHPPRPARLVLGQHAERVEHMPAIHIAKAQQRGCRHRLARIAVTCTICEPWQTEPSLSTTIPASPVGGSDESHVRSSVRRTRLRGAGGRRATVAVPRPSDRADRDDVPRDDGRRPVVDHLRRAARRLLRGLRRPGRGPLLHRRPRSPRRPARRTATCASRTSPACWRPAACPTRRPRSTRKAWC